MYKGIQGYTWVYKGIYGIQGYTWVYKGIQGYTEVYRGMIAKMYPVVADRLEFKT